MKTLILILALTMQAAEASWVGKFCQNIFSKFAVEDPYQYEEVLTDALVAHYTRLGIKGAWGTLEEAEAQTMNIMGAELRWRMGNVMRQFETNESLMRIDVALGVYDRYEGQAVQTKETK